MNFLFRTLILFGAIVVIGLFTALLAPMWIDWSHYTEEFEKEVSEIIGQPVKVQGKTTLRLLPLPFIRFEGLEIGRNDDGSSLMTVEAFSLNAEIVPLLSGDLQIVDIEMTRPVVNLKFGTDGQLAWTNPSTLPIAPAHIEIERLVVRDGSGTIAGLADKQEYSFRELDAEISADSLLGPWRLSGTTVFEGDPTGFSVSTGSYQSGSKSLRLKLDLAPQAVPYNFVFNGPIESSDGVPRWSGEFDVNPRPVADLVSEASPKVPLPISLGGVFDALPGTADIKEYRLEVKTDTSPYVVTGSGKLEFGSKSQFYIEADGRQIQLEDLSGASVPGSENKQLALQDRLENLRALAEKIPVPDMQGVVDIRLPAVLTGDTIIRDVVANVSPDKSGWRINRLNALLPGNSTLETSGRLDVKGSLGFDGRLLLASRQPTGLVNWMGGDVSSQIRGLKRVGLDAHVVLSPNQVTFENMELRMDDAVLAGKLRRLQPPTGPPAVVVEISGNRVNTDNLMALYSLIGSDNDNLVAGHHLNVAISANELKTRYGEVPIEAKNVDAKLHIAEGNLSIERLSASDFFGSRIGSTGSIENLTSRPNGNLKVSVEAQSAARLFGFLNQASGGFGYLEHLARDRALSSDTRLVLELDATGLGESADGRIVANGTIGGSQVSVLLQFNGGLELGEKLPLQLNATYENQSVLQAMRQFGLETLPDLFGDEPEGPASVSLTLDGSVTEGFNTRFSATSRNSSFSFFGPSRLSRHGLADTTADIRLVSGDLLPYLNSLGVRLPTDLKDRLSASFRGKLEKKGAAYHLAELTGRLAGVAIKSGDISVETGKTLTEVDAELSVSQFDLAILGEALLGRSPNTNLPGYSEPALDTNFTSAYYPNTDMKLKLSADKVSIGSLLAGDTAQVSARLGTNSLVVDQFAFNALGGSLSGAARLSNNQGSALASANYQFEKLSVDALLDTLKLDGVGGIEGGSLTGSGSFEASGVSLSALANATSGEGFAMLADSRLNGFDATAFDQVLAVADQNRFEVNTESVNRLVEDIVLKSHLDVDRADIPFSINRGRMKVRNITRKVGNALFNAGFETSLVTGNIESEVNMSFRPGRRDSYIGAEPHLQVVWAGEGSAFKRRVDASALEGYLALRALETSQRRIETLEAGVFEKQRYQALASYVQAKRAHEERVRQRAKAIAEEMALREAEEEKARQETEAERRKQLDQEAEAEKTRLKALEGNNPKQSDDPKESVGSPVVRQSLEPLVLPSQPKQGVDVQPGTSEDVEPRKNPSRIFLDLFRRNDER